MAFGGTTEASPQLKRETCERVNPPPPSPELLLVSHQAAGLSGKGCQEGAQRHKIAKRWVGVQGAQLFHGIPTDENGTGRHQGGWEREWVTKTAWASRAAENPGCDLSTCPSEASRSISWNTAPSFFSSGQERSQDTDTREGAGKEEPTPRLAAVAELCQRSQEEH